MNNLIGVIGAGECSKEVYNQAFETGKLLAENKYPIICGGLGGVMEAVCKGAKSAKGITIGVLPGNETSESNQYVDIPIATGMGIGRNIIIIRSSSVVVAINGKFGTLSEIAFALQLNKIVIGINTWDIAENIIKINNAKEAVIKINQLLKNV